MKLLTIKIYNLIKPFLGPHNMELSKKKSLHKVACSFFIAKVCVDIYFFIDK